MAGFYTVNMKFQYGISPIDNHASSSVDILLIFDLL